MKKPLLLLLCLFTVIGYAKDPHINNNKGFFI